MRRISTISAKPEEHYKGIRICADTGLHGQIADMILPVLSPGARILDFGAGQGAMSARLADLGFTVTSVDKQADSFKASTPFEQLDFDDPQSVETFAESNLAAFDLVLGIEVIEHVENPWAYVRILSTMVTADGYLLLSTPNVTSWYSRVKFLFTGRLHQFEDSDRAYGHINPIAEDELRLILKGCGLKVEKISPGGWLPRLWLRPNPSVLLSNLFGFFASFLMKGTWDGWCLIALARKK